MTTPSSSKDQAAEVGRTDIVRDTSVEEVAIKKCTRTTRAQSSEDSYCEDAPESEEPGDLDFAVGEEMDFEPSKKTTGGRSSRKANPKKRTKIDSDSDDESLPSDPALDLDSFYTSDDLLLDVDTLTLPSHLTNLIYFPHSNLTDGATEQPESKIEADKWWFLETRSSPSLSSACVDHEMKLLVSKLDIYVPNLLPCENAEGFTLFEKRHKRGRFDRIIHCSIGMEFPPTMTKEAAIQLCIETNPYFKQKFPCAPYETDFPPHYAKAVDKDGLPINALKLVDLKRNIPSVTNWVEVVETEVVAATTEYERKTSCPSYYEDLDPAYFKAICRGGTNKSRRIDFYFDVTKFHKISSLTFARFTGLFLHDLKKHTLALIPRASSIAIEPVVSSLSERSNKAISWMIEKEDNESEHALTNLEGGLTLRFEGLPGKLVNLSEGTVVTTISRQTLEPFMHCFGGILEFCGDRAGNEIANDVIKISTEIYPALLEFIAAKPLHNFEDLKITDFQKNFLLPSRATMILLDECTSMKTWRTVVAASKTKLKVIFVPGPVELKDLRWEQVMFADVIIVDWQNLTNRYSNTSEPILRDRKGIQSTVLQCEPSGLSKMKKLIQDRSIGSKGVDFSGIYWHRVIYDHRDNTSSTMRYATDWKWVAGRCSQTTAQNVFGKLEGASRLRAFMMRFALSFS